jgi:hypothetical protein
MSAKRDTRPLLGALAGVLLVLFLADLLGLLPGAGATEAAGVAGAEGPRAVYEQRAEAMAQDRALLDAEERWRAVEEEARAEWERVRAGLVPGATVELAEARFRESVAAALSDIKISSPLRMTIVREPGPAEPASRLRRIVLRVEFEVTGSREVFSAVDRLENMPDAMTRISQVTVSGPGRIQVPQQVTVGMTVSAVALIGEGAS